MVQVWYPADKNAAQAPQAPYLPEFAQTGPALAHKLGLPSFLLSHLAHTRSRSHERAPFASSLGRVPPRATAPPRLHPHLTRQPPPLTRKWSPLTLEVARS